MRRLKIILLSILISFSLVPQVGLAANCDKLEGQFKDAGGNNSGVLDVFSKFKYCSVEDLVSSVIKWALSIAFGLAVLFVILGGFRYMTSGGNPEAVKKAQSMIQWALAGIALVALATTIVVIVTRLVAG
jgi:hypothetical protein